MQHARVAAMPEKYDIVIVGGGAAGCAVAASLFKRAQGLSIAVIEPCAEHYYQPAWTLVGGGAFDCARTERKTERVVPRGVVWVEGEAKEFAPEHNKVLLEDGTAVVYRALIVCPGLKLNAEAVMGLKEALGSNGVTSNYYYEKAPYTWDLVKNMKRGTAIFTQPPMPIKCAGAPQKAMYLACDYWLRKGVLNDISVEFHNAGAVLFGVKEFVPPLMEYVKKYGIKLHLGSNLVSVNGSAKKAVFETKGEDGVTLKIEKPFDMLHAVPPQTAPDFIRQSPLAAESGWVSVDPETMRHTKYGNIFSLGDASSTPNAKTAAAVRRQAPIVAENILAVLGGKEPRAVYNGYGACPLTVERGKVILAEFGYNGKLLPTFPLDPTKARRWAWILKVHLLPPIYWQCMLRGREWLAKPNMKSEAAAPAQRKAA